MKKTTENEEPKQKRAVYVTKVFKRNKEAFDDPNIRYIINQGGSRSSKTYSLAQMLCIYGLAEKSKRISIVRKEKSTIRNTSFKDFVEVLSRFDEKSYKINYTNLTITFEPSKSTISFYGADKDQKLKGMKHDVCFVNECNELSYDDFVQLDLRTKGKMIFDYNPSEEVKFLEEVKLEKEKTVVIHSTYKDNAFLTESQIKAIESYKDKDETIYEIYTLGLPAVKKERIFANIDSFEEWPEGSEDYFVYGLDFGFADPTALVKVWVKDGKIFIEELLYESNLNTNELIDRMAELNISKNTEIYADISRPDLISSLEDEGYVFGKTIKDISAGYGFMRNNKIMIHKQSYNARKEFRNHNWRTVGGKITDKPTDFMNHLIDAARYASYGHFGQVMGDLDIFLIEF